MNERVMTAEEIDRVLAEVYDRHQQRDPTVASFVLERLQAAHTHGEPELGRWLDVAGTLQLVEAAPIVYAQICARCLPALDGSLAPDDPLHAAVNAARAVFRPDDPQAPPLVARLLFIADTTSQECLSDRALLGAVLLDAGSWWQTLIQRLPMRFPSPTMEPVLRAAGGWVVAGIGPDGPKRAELFEVVWMFEQWLRLAPLDPSCPMLRAVALELLAVLAVPADLRRLLGQLAIFYSQDSSPVVRAGVASAIKLLRARQPMTGEVLGDLGLVGVEVLLRAAERAPDAIFYGGPRV